jgi:hypothetical protein
MPTNQYSCDSTGWTGITAGDAAALVQLDTNGPIRVRKESAAPDPSDTFGIVMERNKLATISFDVLDGEDLYIRAIDGDDERVTVIT